MFKTVKKKSGINTKCEKKKQLDNGFWEIKLVNGV